MSRPVSYAAWTPGRSRGKSHPAVALYQKPRLNRFAGLAMTEDADTKQVVKEGRPVLGKAIEEVRNVLKTMFAAFVVFALLSLNTCARLNERPVWDDLYAWLLLKEFSAQLPLVTRQTQNERRLGWSANCGDLQRKNDAGQLMLYTPECPYDGELIRQGGTYSGWYQSEFWLTPVYPTPARLRVYLYQNRYSSLFLSNEPADVKLDFAYRGEKFQLFDPWVTAFDEDKQEMRPNEVVYLPFQSYLIARHSKPADHHVVLRKQSWSGYFIGPQDGPPSLIRVDPEDYEPVRWNEAKTLLAKRGLAPNLDQLALSDPNILKALAEAYGDPSDVSVAGVALPAKLVLQTFSLLLLAIIAGAFAAVSTLESAAPEEPHGSAWLFAARRGAGKGSSIVQGVLLTVALATIVAPLACFIVQTNLHVWPSGWAGWLLGLLNLFAALCSTGLLAHLHITLLTLRTGASI